MINIVDKKDCNGCCACVDICARKAISLKTDIEGFWYPEVDKSLCVECGLCERTCPELHAEELKKNDFEKPICNVSVNKNIEVRFDSTSGGLFSALAAEMYRQGGYVGGAAFNKDVSVSHFISNDKEDLPALRSSKYLQSNASGLYKDVKKFLELGEKVLVCGCPCQMAAMRRFLDKEYDNLIIVDLVCRGINSPKVFRKYIESVEEEHGSKAVFIKSKCKELGWRNLTQKVILENGKTVFQPREKNLFTKGYLSTNVYCRPSCYDCKFKGFPRIADITLGDFWGIENIDTTMDNDLGTSMVLINSEKGKIFFQSIQQKVQSRELPFETILPGNPSLVSSLGKPVIDREQFFKDLDVSTFNEVANKYFPLTKSVRSKVADFLRAVLMIVRQTRLHLYPLTKLIKYNIASRNVHTNFRMNGFLLPTPYSVIDIHRKSFLNLNGTLVIGEKTIRNSKLETRLFLRKGAKLDIERRFTLGYGGVIEVHENAHLTIKSGHANTGLTIVCADRIEIGHGVRMGRHVTIRDNNGGHMIVRTGYRNTKPVIIGDRAWLCEGCTILPGVKIGEGAVVGAGSVVFSDVPAHSIVSGNPAKVVDEDVLLKF
jgi:acetyltransferase-like isoleucine patch superfamily enzyme/coenzyme F420-reducing hydrogenase beta subunit